MGKVIAVCGKGGSGKTTLVALMVKILARENEKKVLLIDADPTGGLQYALGRKAKKTVGELREEVIRAARQVRTQEEKSELAGSIDYLVMDTVTEYDNFSFLAMGRQQGPGCFCPVNDLLKRAIESVAENYDLIIIDGEAGIEQISRQVMRKVDAWIIVTDSSVRGFETVDLLRDVINSLMPHPKMYLVINKLKKGADYIFRRAEKSELEILGYLEEEEIIAEYDSIGRPLTELPLSSPVMISVQGFLKRVLCEKNEISKMGLGMDNPDVMKDGIF